MGSDQRVLEKRKRLQEIFPNYEENDTNKESVSEKVKTINDDSGSETEIRKKFRIELPNQQFFTSPDSLSLGRNVKIYKNILRIHKFLFS